MGVRARLGVLKVFISKGCLGCKRALELASWARRVKPNLDVDVVDLSTAPDTGQVAVFAVPTYVYNNRAVCMGNPSQKELQRWLDNLNPEV